MTSLYDPIVLGDMKLGNRVFMAPLTRNRATPNGVPGPWASTYYSQRASAGLIVSEATQISPMGKGYINTPGIHSEEQIAGWKPVVDAVHRSGGRIFLQLWHVGRISHSSLLPGNASPVAPSAIRARAQTVVETGFVDVSEPRALSLTEIRHTIEDYGRAASNAKAAGFDGVEIHAANGYLIDQFLRSNSNVRTDTYGGSAANRARFLGEVVEAVLERLGSGSRWGTYFPPRYLQRHGRCKSRGNIRVRCGCAQRVSARIPARRGRHHPASIARRTFSDACARHGRGSMSPTEDTMLSGASARSRTDLPMPWPMAGSSSRTPICPRA